ncbi:MAG: sensor domain-containing protein, partial [Actinoplanes sp.]
MRLNVRSWYRGGVDALTHLAGGLGTAVLAFGTLLWLTAVVVSCLVGVGLLLLPGALSLLRSVADRERGRLSRWGPREILSPGPVPGHLREAVRDPFVHRELGWLAVHGTFGFVTGLFGLTLPLNAAQYLSFPFWYGLLPPGQGGPGLASWSISNLGDALLVALLGVGWLILAVFALGAIAQGQALPGRWLLRPPADVDLSLRVAELTATRAAALDAHAVELRRIERSLHDGTQNRLVAVTVLVGAARRAMTRDPAVGAEMLDRAQEAAEQALAELRTVVRGILPPVLDSGLAGALDGLAGGCAVPCRIDVDLPGRCAASVEATAY